MWRACYKQQDAHKGLQVRGVMRTKLGTFFSILLVTEMPHASEDHRHLMLIGRLDDLLVAD